MYKNVWLVWFSWNWKAANYITEAKRSFDALPIYKKKSKNNFERADAAEFRTTCDAKIYATIKSHKFYCKNSNIILHFQKKIKVWQKQI